MNLRSLARTFCYTQNTIRYRVEWPRILEAWRRVGKVRTLFDGGAGSGEFSRLALQNELCDEAIALELEPANYALLEENLGRDPRSRLIRGSVLSIPLPDQSVDMVMSTQVIEHIHEHEKAAEEFNRILRPGGHAIITTPHPPEPFPNSGHVREGYTEDDFRTLFLPHRWEMLHSDYFLTKGTVDAMLRAEKLPARGVYLPVALIDREKKLSRVQRAQRRPFGILALFQKPQQNRHS